MVPGLDAWAMKARKQAMDIAVIPNESYRRRKAVVVCRGPSTSWRRAAAEVDALRSNAPMAVSQEALKQRTSIWNVVLVDVADVMHGACGQAVAWG